MKNNYLILFSFLLLFSCDSKHSYKIPGAYHALQQMNEARSYPEQDIPSDAYKKGIDFHIKHYSAPSSKAPVDPWEAMGPLNTAGRCLALAINPQSDSTLYLGSASGGLWRSRRLGLGITWEYIPTAPDVLGVSSIAFAANDSMQMYIGTGEVYNYDVTGNDGAYRSTRGSYGVGILKSEDGGATWVKSLDWSYQNQKGVQAVRVDQSNANNVFAATTDGVYKSSDAGESWQLVLDVIMATDIEIDGQNILAACGNFGTPGKGIYRSTDGGENWNQISDADIPPNFQGKILLARAPSDPSVVYASIGNGFTGATGASWLLRSSDGGESWDLKNTLDYSRWQGWFAHDVSVSPENPNVLTVVGIEIFNSYDGGETLTLTAGGGNLTFGTPPIDGPDGGPYYSHADHHVVTHHPTLTDVVLIGNDGGLFLSRDGAETVRSANGGLQTTQFYNGFSVSQQDSLFAMGGLQDNSTVIFRGSGAWERTIGGDGSWTAISSDNDQIIFGSWQNLNIRKSIDQGENFYYLGSLPIAGQGIFIAPYGMAPSQPDIMYAASNRVYRSIDQGETWDPTNNDNPINGDRIYSMTISPINPDQVYVGTAPQSSGAALFHTQDGGESWENVTANLPDRYVNDIAFDPFDEAKAYVVLNGFGSGHLYVTEDYGNSWTDLSTQLPDVPGNAVIVDPNYPNHIYYGNDIGAYVSLDGGQSWDNFSEGLYGSAIVMDLKISPSDQKLWVATHGSGSFRRDLIEESSGTQLTQNTLDPTIITYPNPAQDHVQLQIDVPQPKELNISLRDINGRSIQQKENLVIQKTQVLNFPLSSLPDGEYIFIIEDIKTKRIISKKLIKQ